MRTHCSLFAPKINAFECFVFIRTFACEPKAPGWYQPIKIQLQLTQHACAHTYSVNDFVRPAISLCIRFGVPNSLCELRSPKSELSRDGPWDRRPEREHYHPSWQFTRPPFSRSLFRLDYKSGCCFGVQGGVSEIWGDLRSNCIK